MNIELQHSELISEKKIVISGSKSESNRLLVLQKLFPEITITNLSDSDDVQAMVNGLLHKCDDIDVHHAGTTMRFLTAYFALCTDQLVTLTGSQRMKERPIGVLVEALQQLNTSITYLEKEGYPPLQIKGVKSNGGKVVLPADISSQYITALLLVGTSFEYGLTIELEGAITSRPYIEMTLQLISSLGSKTSFEANVITVGSVGSLLQKEFVVESDWSSASYFYGLLALGKLGDEITLAYLKKTSIQGDAKVAELYSLLGIETVYHQDESITLRKVFEADKHFEANLIETPDLAQTIAVTCFGLGISCKLKGLHTLKIKETDRLLALKCELTKLGAIVEVTDDSFYLEGGSKIIPNCSINTYQDHRMAMSFAILAMKTNLSINDAEVVTKSFVNYWSNLCTLGIRFVSK